MPLIKLSYFLKEKAKKIIIILNLTALVIFLLLALPMQSHAQPSANTSHLKPLTDIPSTAQVVETGFYPVNLYDLDIASNTYYVDTYIWFKWKGKIDPLANLEFPNAVEEWGMSLEKAYEVPQLQSDESFYQVIRVEGRFFVPFTLAKYPLDEQRLEIVMENSIYADNELVYVADAMDSGSSETLALPGWKITNWTLENFLHDYSSQFGEKFRATINFPYSSVRYQLLISRPINYFLWKLLLPLVIVVISSWGALLLHPSYVDARTSMSSTALLTTVFLQQSYSDTLPEVGYLVLLDKLYALSYLLIVSAIAETIITASWAKSGNEEDYQRVIRLDRPFLVAQFAVLLIGFFLLIYL